MTSPQQPQPEKVHGDPVDPNAEREVESGDVAEDPAAPDEDGKDPRQAPPDPSGIPDAHPSNSQDED